jgi:LuxR family transcriptional regulator, maltose regulon positive regulatory protein
VLSQTDLQHTSASGAPAATIPAPDGVARPRLLRLLDGRTRWTFVRAPRGYDASLTVQAWLHGDRKRLARARWIRLDGPQSVSPRDIARHFGRVRRGRILVLDATGSRTELAVEDVRALGQEASRVVVIARSIRVLPDHIPALVHAPLITRDDLAYSPAEIAQILTDAAPEIVHQVRSLTAGWPVLVRLMTAAYRPGEEGDGRRSGDRALAGFADNLLAELSPPARQVVQASSLVEEPTAHLASVLTDLSHDDVRAAWQEATDSGLTAAHPGGDVDRWAFVPGLREVIWSALDRTEPQRARELRVRTASWYRDEAEPLEAIRHAIAGQDWDCVMDVLEESLTELFLSKPAAVRELLHGVPAAVFATRHVSSVVHELIAHGNVEEPQFLPHVSAYGDAGSRGLSEAAEATSGNDAPWEITGTEWRESIGARHRGEFEKARQFRTKFLDRLTDTSRPLEAPTRAFLPMHYLQCGITSMLAGQFTDAHRDLVDATLVGSGPLASFVQRDAFGDLALLAAVEGDIPQAREHLRRMESRPRVVGYWGRAVRFGELVAESLVATARGDGVSAGTALTVASRTADRDELWPFYLLARARHALLAGDALPALAEIARFRAVKSHLAGPSSAAAFVLAVAEAELLLATDQAARAGEVLRHEPPHPFLWGLAALQSMQIGDVEQAIRQGGEVLWSDDAPPASRALAGLARAASQLRDGDSAGAASSYAFVHGFMTRFELPFLWGMVPRADLLELMRLAGLSHNLTDVPSLLPAPLTPATLTPRERVVLAHLAGGSSLPVIARELFVSENTVRSQARSVYRKLGVGTRDEAVAEAVKRGITL